MLKRSKDNEPTEPDKPDYAAEIISIANEFDLELPERAISLATALLQQVYEKYGNPSSESYKPYHNDQHALNVIRRSFRLWSLLLQTLPDKIDAEGSELLLIAGAGHDLVLGSGKDQGYDERESARITARHMRGVGYSEAQTSRVVDAIETTAVVRDDDNNIIQNNIRTGSKDPLRLALATADINGAMMEGRETLIEDALNLYSEHSGIQQNDVNTSELAHFLKTQEQFINGRLAAIRGDLKHYFTDKEADKVSKAYEREFTASSVETVSLSRNLPETALDMVEKVTKSIGSSAIAPIKGALKTAFRRSKDSE